MGWPFCIILLAKSKMLSWSDMSAHESRGGRGGQIRRRIPSSIGIRTLLKLWHPPSNHILMIYSNDILNYSLCIDSLITSMLVSPSLTAFLSPHFLHIPPTYTIDLQWNCPRWSRLQLFRLNLNFLVSYIFFGLQLKLSLVFYKCVKLKNFVWKKYTSFSQDLKIKLLHLTKKWLYYT